MIRIAICDDERDFLQKFSEIINAYNPFNGEFRIYTYRTGRELISEKEVHFDLIFLDIQMPMIDGVETAKYLRKQGVTSVLVFLTSINVPSIETFKVSPYRYLIKNMENKYQTDLKDIFSEVVKRIEVLLVKTEKGLSEIKISQILYFTINHKSVDIVTDHGKFNTKDKIGDIAEKILPYGFAFSHKSYLVNLNRIFSLNRTTVILDNGMEIPVSQPKSISFRNTFSEYAEQKAEVLK